MKKSITIICMLTITAFANAQTTAWIKQLNEEENFVVAGATKYFTVAKAPTANISYIVRAFNNSGTLLATTSVMPNSAYTAFLITKVLASASDELFILGSADVNSTATSPRDGILIKFNSSLNQSWQTTITWGNALKVQTHDLAIKGSNILVLTEAHSQSYTIDRAELRSINRSTGITNLTFQSTALKRGYRIALDQLQNVYISGTSNATGYVAAIEKINTSLISQWSRTYAPGFYNGFGDVATDISNNVYVTGFSQTTSGGLYRSFVRKYNSSGTLLSSYITPASTTTGYRDPRMRITVAGEVFMAVGTRYQSNNTNGIQVFKLSPANINTVLYTTTCSFSQSFNAMYLTGFEATQGGKVFVTATNQGGTNLTQNYVAAKLRTDGSQEFSEVYNGGRCNYMIKAIPGIYPNDEFITTGIISNINMLIKYTGPGARIMSETIADLPSGELKINCYPNPATSELTIENPGVKKLYLELYNMEWKKIIADKTADAATFDVSGLPRGNYILKISNEDNISETKKIILH